MIHGFHTSPWHTRTSKAVPTFDPTPDERRELLALAEAAGPRLHHLPRQLLLERLDPASLAAELLRVQYGPDPDTANPFLDVEATFTAQDSDAVRTTVHQRAMAAASGVVALF